MAKTIIYPRRFFWGSPKNLYIEKFHNYIVLELKEYISLLKQITEQNYWLVERRDVMLEI